MTGLEHAKVVMFADAENGILPGLLIMLLFFPATFLTLAGSLAGKRNWLMIVCAMLALALGVWGMADAIVHLAKDFRTPDGWPPPMDFFYILSLFVYLVGAGGILLWKMRRTK